MAEWLIDKWRRLRRHPSANAVMVLAAMLLTCAVAVKWYSGKLSDSPSWAIYLALSAAVLGLFREVIVRFIWFPELELIFQNTSPYCDDPLSIGGAPGNIPFHVETIYFRPLVINKGTARAEKVEVMLLDVYVPQPNNAQPVFDRQYSMNLGWANSGEAVRQGAKLTVWEGLNPGMRRFIDLGKIYEPAARIEHLGFGENLPNVNGPIFSVEVEVPGNHRSYLLPPGDWELTLLLSAANHRTLRYRVTIHLTAWIAGGMNAMLDPDTGGVNVIVTPVKRKLLGEG
jgi:hypothetical protein